MFCKPVNPPWHLLQYEAYARRLPPGSLRKKIEQQIKNYRAGFNGEKSLEPQLISLPDKDFLVFHDLRLSNGLYCFQIDYLILTAAYFLIVEVKNIAGTIHLDFAAHTLTRHYNGKTEVYQDPTVQSSALRLQLQDWLTLHGVALAPPVLDLVVFAQPGTCIDLVNGTSAQEQKVIRGPILKQRLLSLTTQYPAKQTSAKTLSNLAQQLITANCPKKIDLVADGTISNDDLIKGVQCPNCGHIPMNRTTRNWCCPVCGQASPKAYLAALDDYQLIYGSEITGKKCMDFLQLSSLQTSRYLLRSTLPNVAGVTRDRVYYLKKLKNN